MRYKRLHVVLLFSPHQLRNVSIQLHSPLPSCSYHITLHIDSVIRVEDGTSLFLSLSRPDSCVSMHFMACLPMTIEAFVLPYVSLDQQALTLRTSCMSERRSRDVNCRYAAFELKPDTSSKISPFLHTLTPVLCYNLPATMSAPFNASTTVSYRPSDTLSPFSIHIR